MDLYITVTVLLSLATLLAFLGSVLYSRVQVNERKYRGLGQQLPPGSLGWPFIGEMREFLKCFKNEKPDLFIQVRDQRYMKCGLYKTCIFGVPSILATSPDAISFVLKRDNEFGPGWPSLGKIMGHNAIVSVTGELHKTLRRHLYDAIASPEGMRKALPRVDAAIRANLERWAKEEYINIRERTKNITFYVIANNFLSMEPSPQLDAISNNYNGFMEGIRALPVYFPGTAYFKAINCRRRLVFIFESIISKRQSAVDQSDDFLRSLMETRDSSGQRLTNEQLTDNLVTTMLAGYESSAYTMMWTLILLEKYPKCLEKLRAEHMFIRKKLGDKVLSLEDTKEMKYTQKVIDETLRLVNTAPMLFRTVLEDVEYKGYTIPKGWKILPWVRAPHMDSDYFSQPEIFNPDRWDDLDLVSEAAFNPFGGGPRTCPGNQFAKLAISVFLHHVAVGYQWRLLNPDAKIEHLPHPKPVDGGPMIFTSLH